MLDDCKPYPGGVLELIARLDPQSFDVLARFDALLNVIESTPMPRGQHLMVAQTIKQKAADVQRRVVRRVPELEKASCLVQELEIAHNALPSSDESFSRLRREENKLLHIVDQQAR